VDRVNRLDVAMMRTPDGYGRLELAKFRTPAAISAEVAQYEDSCRLCYAEGIITLAEQLIPPGSS
jgi:hypothetical protein